MLTTNDLRRHWRRTLQRVREEGPQVVHLHGRPLLRIRALGPPDVLPAHSLTVPVTDFLLQSTPYLWRAAGGERILITRWGKPVALLEPLDVEHRQDKGKIKGVRSER